MAESPAAGATRLEWYKRYPRDFREGTRKLTLEQRSIYSDLLDLIYETGNQLVDDDTANAHHLHVGLRIYRRVKGELVALGKLFQAHGFLCNPRAIDETLAATNRILKARSSASLGGKSARKSEPKSSNFNGSGGANGQADAQQVEGKKERRDLESLSWRSESSDSPARLHDDKAAAPIELRFVERCQITGANPTTVRNSIATWRAAIPPGKVLTILDAATGKNNPYAYAGRAVGYAITELDAARHAATQPEQDPWLEAIRRNRQRDEEQGHADFPSAARSLPH